MPASFSGKIVMGDAGGSTVTITASGPVEKTSEEESPVEALEGEFGSWPRYDRGPVTDPADPARAGVPAPEREEGGVRRTGDALRDVRGEDPAAPWDDPSDKVKCPPGPLLPHILGQRCPGSWGFP